MDCAAGVTLCIRHDSANLTFDTSFSPKAGVLLYEMIRGKPPFQSGNHALLVTRILSLQIQWNARPHDNSRSTEFGGISPCSDDARDVIVRMLRSKPEDRIQLKSLWEHVWLKRDGAAGTKHHEEEFLTPLVAFFSSFSRIFSSFSQFFTNAK